MAPRTTTPKRDGAKPGAEHRDGSERYAFDADDRAATREAAANTIGGVDYFRRKKTWEVTRELKKLLRGQERLLNRSDRLGAQIDALTEEIRGVQDVETGRWIKPPVTDEAKIEETEAKIEELEDQQDQAGDEADESAYQIIALLLRDKDGNAPEIAKLKEDLDMKEAGELSRLLWSGAEVTPDPTTTATSSSS